MTSELTNNTLLYKNKDSWYKIGVHGYGLHFLYLGTLVQVFSDYLPLYFIYFFLFIQGIGSMVLVWASLRSIHKRWGEVYVKKSIRIIAYLIPYVVFFSFINAMYYDLSIYWKIMKFFPYLWVVIAFAGIDEHEWEELIKVFRIHALIGTVVFLALFIKVGPVLYVDRSSFFNDSFSTSETQSPLVLSRQLLYSYPILLILIPNEKRFWQIIAIATTMCMATWGLMSQTRSTLITSVGLTLVFAIYSWYKDVSIDQRRKRLGMLMLFAFILFGVIFISISSSIVTENISIAFNGIIQRLDVRQMDSAESASFDNGRFIEGLNYVENLTIVRAIIGDPGGWISPSNLELHVGYLRYITYGGLPTFIVIIILVYWHGWRGIFLSRRLSVLCAASVVASHSIQAISSGMLYPYPQVAMLFICSGYCWHQTAVDEKIKNY